MKWNDEKHNYLVDLIKNHGTKWKHIAELMTNRFGESFSYDQVRARWRTNKDKIEYKPDPQETYGKKIKKNEDGSLDIDQLIEISKEQLKDDDYILDSHGYDPAKWEITSHQFSMWNHHNKVDGTKTLYSSKIKIAPKSNKLNWDELIKAIENREPKEPIPFKKHTSNESTYLELPFFDLHFGPATIEFYENTLQETLALLQKSYREVLIVVGQDCLHNDNFKGTTANGTPIDKVDMVKAVDDAEVFYETIIAEAVKNSSHVTVMYSKGNHDESMAYMLARGLRNTFRKQPNITFDLSVKERKAYMLGTNFLGVTHGDKNRKNIAANFSIEFPQMWAKATTREVHMGHLHRKRTTKQPLELTIDEKGVIVRELGTGNPTDQYHEDNGFNLAHKEFEIFEYAETKKKHIHYV